VNRQGVEQALPIKLNDAELAGLKNSAEEIKQAIRAVGF
jgi:malate/lactate dehydrogenase